MLPVQFVTLYKTCKPKPKESLWVAIPTHVGTPREAHTELEFGKGRVETETRSTRSNNWIEMKPKPNLEALEG